MVANTSYKTQGAVDERGCQQLFAPLINVSFIERLILCSAPRRVESYRSDGLMHEDVNHFLPRSSLLFVESDRSGG